MAKKYYWLKLKRDFFKRHDIQIIEAMPNGKDYILFYLKLLCESVDHDGNLRFSDEIPYNAEMLATITRTNVDVVRNAINVFTELHMMEVMDDGTLYMNEVEKMLGAETEWAEKKRAYREKQKMLESGQCPNYEDNVPTMSDKSKSKSKSKSNNTKRKAFVPPTADEVRSYCKERKNSVDAEAFVDFYESKGWMVGKNKMKDWKAAVRTWERSRSNEVKPTNIEPPKYKEFEPEPEIDAVTMPEEIREKLGGLFNAG